MKRRTFVKGSLAAVAELGLADFVRAFAAGTDDAAAGRPLAAWQPGHFQIHAIYTGVCESLFLVYPDGTTLLIDVGDHPAHTRGKLAIPILPGLDRHAGEWVARYVQRVNPQGSAVDRFLLSHYHSDHGGGRSYSAGPSADGSYEKSGIGQAIDFLTFKRVVDRAWPTFDDPLPKDPKEDGGMVENLRAVYAALQTRGTQIEKFRLEKGGDQFAPLRGRADGFSVRPICANGRFLLPDGTVQDLYRHLVARPNPPKRFNENGMSLGMVFTYGKFRFFTAGDLSDGITDAAGRRIQTEDLLGAASGAVNVAKVNHHGHHAMFPGLVKALKATVSVPIHLHTHGHDDAPGGPFPLPRRTAAVSGGVHARTADGRRRQGLDEGRPRRRLRAQAPRLRRAAGRRDVHALLRPRRGRVDDGRERPEF